MNCPNCNEKIEVFKLDLCGAYLASDNSYATAEGECPHCREQLEFYYPLTECNGVRVN